jgi:hypothetical protein
MHRATLAPILAVTSAAVLALTAGTAGAQTSQPQRQCFTFPTVRGTQPVGDTALNIRVNTKDVWRLTLAAPCPGLRQASRLLDFQPTASSVICSASDLRLGVSIAGSRTECFTDKLAKLTPDEVAALAPRDRP